MTGKKSQIGLRMPTRDVKLLKRISESRGEDLSDFVRRAIRTEMAKLDFLSSMEKKALGIRSKEA